MKIILLESLAISDKILSDYKAKLNEMGHEFFAYEKDGNEDTQISRVKDADVIIIANMPLSANVINSCTNLKFINVAFTGVDHVALTAAKEKQAAVSNASGYATQSVAELVIGYAISLLRNVPRVDQRCRDGQTKDGLVGNELSGKTIGIVGGGAIGLRTAALFHAFDCKILAYDPSPQADTPAYISFVSLEDVLKQADLVSLHCPLLDSTKGLMNQERIALMKKSAFLINAARGPIVDSQALADALNRGDIAGAAIDVFETEPPLATDHVLLHSKNTIVTPHIAFASKESMELRAKIVFDSLFSWMNGTQLNKII
jgi:D-3-phosphoglycerate dehydrogenase